MKASIYLNANTQNAKIIMATIYKDGDTNVEGWYAELSNELNFCYPCGTPINFFTSKAKAIEALQNAANENQLCTYNVENGEVAAL